MRAMIFSARERGYGLQRGCAGVRTVEDAAAAASMVSGRVWTRIRSSCAWMYSACGEFSTPHSAAARGSSRHAWARAWEAAAPDLFRWLASPGPGNRELERHGTRQSESGRRVRAALRRGRTSRTPGCCGGCQNRLGNVQSKMRAVRDAASFMLFARKLRRAC